MERRTLLLTIAIVLGLTLAIQVLPTQKEATAWGLPEGFNPRTGKIEKAPDMHRARAFIGTNAFSKNGELLGTVVDMLFSDDGRVKYVVLARGVTEGSERMVPIPWKAAHPEVKDHRLVLNVNTSTFENAPSFAWNDWRKFADPQWEREVNSYY